MLFDGRGSTPDPEPYDVLIVGSGPAGMALALELEAAGLSIAILESGGQDLEPEAQDFADGPVTGNEAGVDLAAIRLRMLGGTSNHWGGHCAPLDPIDFERAPPGLSGWPISYDAMVPYYARAHPYLDLGAFDYSLDAPSGLSGDDLLLQGDANFRTKVLRQSSPTRFGDAYGARIAASDRIDLWLWTHVAGIVLDADGAVERVETRAIGGPERAFRARAVVLAGGAVENARQLMLANARAGTAFGDAGGLLGRCYMDHPTNGGGFLAFDRPQPDTAHWTPMRTHATDDYGFQFLLAPTRALLEAENLPSIQYYVIPLAADAEVRARQRAANSAVSSLRQLAKYAVGRDPGPDGYQIGLHYCTAVANADTFVVDRAIRLVSGEGVSEALLKFETEELPDRGNRVFLSERRDPAGQPLAGIAWSQGDDLIESVKRTTTLVGASAGAAGLGRVRLEDHDALPFWGMKTSWHQMGTTRMAESPTSGVCDPQGRVHGTRALYMAGASLFPRAGCSNPTLTIVALSMRMADHLVTEIPRL